MKVSELIENLRQMDPDLRVVCDASIDYSGDYFNAAKPKEVSIYPVSEGAFYDVAAFAPRDNQEIVKAVLIGAIV